MNVYYLGYVVPQDSEDRNEAVSPIGNNMQLGLLTEYEKILKDRLYVYSFLPTSSYKKSRKLFIRKQYKKIQKNLYTQIFPYINIPVIKQLCIFFVSLLSLAVDIFKTKNQRNVIITYHVSVFYTIPTLLIGQIFDVKTICMITDAPIDTSKRKSFIIERLRKVSNTIRLKLIDKYDAYLTINENIIKEFNIVKPYLNIYVGAETINVIEKKDTERLKKPIRISYTGALEDHYNIKKLIKAMEILGNDYELHLYGKGSLTDVIDFTKSNNVYFGGFLNNKIVREIQIESDILITLLSKDSYLGKYAYPGKIFEYLLSGTPIISSNTPSINSEIHPFINFINEENPQNIADTIQTITKQSEYQKAVKRSKEGRRYVIKNCTWKSQITKIDKFINKLYA